MATLLMRNTHQEIVEIVQAFLDGKRVRATVIGKDAFVTVLGGPAWDFAHYRYEILPEPRTIWVNEYDTEDCGLGKFEFADRQAAEDYGRCVPNYKRTIKFIEVME